MFLGLVTCIQPIDPEELNTESLLVIEAMITDQSVHQTVKISRSVAITSSSSFEPVSDAEVELIVTNQPNVPFREIEPGVYQSTAPYAAQPRVAYQLSIETSNGQSYLSDPSEMTETPPFDSLYVEFVPQSSPMNPQGGFFNFYLDINNVPEDNRHFRWVWNSTYELSVPNPSRWLWTGGNTWVIRELGSVNDSLQVEICWQMDTSKQISIKELLPGENEIFREPIHSFHSDSGYLKKKYSIEVKQYALSPESYRYWNLLEQSNAQGFLFDQQVGTIRGNIYNVDRPLEPVLGYFEVLQEQSVRKFYNSWEFRDQNYWEPFPFIINCDEVDPIITGLDEIPTFMEENQFYYTLCYFITSPPSVAFHRIECADCTVHGSTNQKPDFW